MLIEPITAFESSGPGPPGRTHTSTTSYFYEKNSKNKLRVDYYLLLKYCTRQCALIFSTWAELLTKFNFKMQNFKRLLDLNYKYKKA